MISCTRCLLEDIAAARNIMLFCESMGEPYVRTNVQSKRKDCEEMEPPFPNSLFCERVFMFCYFKEYLKVQHWVKQSFVQTRGHASEGYATSHMLYTGRLRHNCFSHKRVFLNQYPSRLTRMKGLNMLCVCNVLYLQACLRWIAMPSNRT